MKKFIQKSILFASLVTIVACQDDVNEIEDSQESLQVNTTDQFVQVKDVSNDIEKVAFAKELLDASQSNFIAKRVGCTLDSDVGCGSDAVEEIEEYINLSGCISFPLGSLIFPIQIREFTYTYSYYVDGDSDINMDRYQFQFDAHVADIASRIAPNKIALVNADATNKCANRRFATSSIIYTVILGN